MSLPRILTRAMVQNALERGVSTAQLAVECNMSFSAAYRATRFFGIKLRRPGTLPKSAPRTWSIVPVCCCDCPAIVFLARGVRVTIRCSTCEARRIQALIALADEAHLERFGGYGRGAA
jgi:hypothetical protein